MDLHVELKQDGLALVEPLQLEVNAQISAKMDLMCTTPLKQHIVMTITTRMEMAVTPLVLLSQDGAVLVEPKQHRIHASQSVETPNK